MEDLQIAGKYLTFDGPVNLGAHKGKNGDLLLDPVNVTISTANQTGNITLGNPSTLVCASSGDTIINSNSLSNALNNGTVTINTATPNCGTATGNISIPGGFSTGSTSPLTLNATGFITAGGAITSGGTINLNTTGTGYNISITSLTAHFITMTTAGSNSNISASGTITASTFSAPITLSTASGNISTQNIVSNEGAITLTAKAGGGFGGNISVASITTQKGPISLAADGSISIVGLSTALMEGQASLNAKGGNINISGFINYKGFSPITLNAGNDITLLGSQAQIISPLSAINITAGNAVTLNSSTNPTSVPTVILAPTDAINITAESLALNPNNNDCTIASTGGSVNLNIGLGGISLIAENTGVASITSTGPISWNGRNGSLGPISLMGASSIFSPASIEIMARGILLAGSSNALQAGNASATITSNSNITISSDDTVQLKGELELSLML